MSDPTERGVAAIRPSIEVELPKAPLMAHSHAGILPVARTDTGFSAPSADTRKRFGRRHVPLLVRSHTFSTMGIRSGSGTCLEDGGRTRAARSVLPVCVTTIDAAMTCSRLGRLARSMPSGQMY